MARNASPSATRRIVPSGDAMRSIRRSNPASTRASSATIAHASAGQPSGLTLRTVEAGNLASLSAGRIGRRTSSPPQFGQRPASTASAHARQKVHSNEQIIASGESGGRSASQHSQLGRSCSM
jgi:hypothetical protein